MVKIGHKYIYPSHGCLHLVVPALVLYYQIQCFITKIHYCSLGGNFYLFHFLLSLSLLGLLFHTSQMTKTINVLSHLLKLNFNLTNSLLNYSLNQPILMFAITLRWVSVLFFLVFLGVLNNIWVGCWCVCMFSCWDIGQLPMMWPFWGYVWFLGCILAFWQNSLETWSLKLHQLYDIQTT